MFDKSSNPVLQDKIFRSESLQAGAKTMTVNGTIEKTGLLLLIVMVAASYTWQKFFNSGDVENAMSSLSGWMFGGAIGGFIVAIATMFLKKYAAYLAPIYAVLEGLFLGAISAFFESMYPGIVMNAVLGTFATFFIMLLTYRTGLIKVNDKFRGIMIVATGAVALTYFMSFLLSFFGVNMSFLHDNSMLSIGISVVVIVIAALNLLMDFDFIERGSAYGAPKYMEWFGAFGLMVTLIWLYLEILRLLSKLQSRN
ncbi:MAG: Bax inhibitor-1/YccA family protein [Bacteroidales bacterium]|nr:Bax inhibitor-1/YccA family protein [Bacteroidales bacterium]